MACAGVWWPDQTLRISRRTRSKSEQVRFCASNPENRHKFLFWETAKKQNKTVETFAQNDAEK